MISPIHIPALWLLLGATPPTPHAAAPECVAIASGRAARLLEMHRAMREIPGMQVAVWRDGRALWSQEFGVADLEQRTPVTPLTRFRIASLSKPLTAAGMMWLVQDGRLLLDAPVSRYVPGFPAKRWPITVRQLAAGTSGIRHYHDAEEADNTTHFASVTDALALFRDDSLLFEPGTQLSYSSPGYVLLSAAMEAASGESYLSYMATHVFAPLGMTSTGGDHPDSLIPFRSRAYVEGEEGRLNAPSIDPSSKWAAGGLLSTATDLARFGSALLRRELLDSASTAAMFAPVVLRNGTVERAALGWDLQTDPAGRRVIAMDGSLPSTRALLLLYPDEGLVLALLLNTGQSVFLNQQEGMLLAEQFLVPECPPIPAAGSAGDWTGDWRMTLRNFNGSDMAGTVQLYRSGGEYRGVVRLDNRFFARRPLTAPAVVVTASGLQLTVLMGGNWIRLVLPADPSRPGEWHLGPEHGEVSGLVRVPAG